MDYFYDGQCRRYLTQFMRVMSNFAYKDAKGKLTQIPVRYGDMNRQVGSILKKNSENTIPSAPFVACYIKDLQYDRPRHQDPTFVSKINIRERSFNNDTNQYEYTQGANYTVERIMPSPWLITFVADFWSTNLDQKLQFWEQLMVLFNPSLELQTTDNYIDWTSLSVLELGTQTFSSRTIPQGVEQDIDILNMTFTSPIWITPPAKVKKLGIITKIINNIHAVANGTIEQNFADPNIVADFGITDAQVVVSPGNYDLLVLDGTAKLIHNRSLVDPAHIFDTQGPTSWFKLLDLYPGKFIAHVSRIMLTKPNGMEIAAYISLSLADEATMLLSFDMDSLPENTIISGKGTIDAIINPETFNPTNKIVGTRYLILENINVVPEFGQPGYDGPVAWKNSDNTDFRAHANDIIQWNGNSWSVIFDSMITTDVVYITNSYTGVQYKWESGSWSKSYEGVYDKNAWRMIL